MVAPFGSLQIRRHDGACGLSVASDAARTTRLRRRLRFARLRPCQAGRSFGDHKATAASRADWGRNFIGLGLALHSREFTAPIEGIENNEWCGGLRGVSASQPGRGDASRGWPHGYAASERPPFTAAIDGPCTTKKCAAALATAMKLRHLCAAAKADGRWERETSWWSRRATALGASAQCDGRLITPTRSLFDW